ncbi:MAG: OadG family protein [Gammaproteobacteria bacterium]|nr:OadG family protein [Gammaproteobacteria bacterium]
MPVTDLLMEGVELMLLGMGSVFVFLAILVLLLKGMSRLALTLAPEEVAIGVASPVGTKPDADDELLAVISAAINRYRSRHK